MRTLIPRLSSFLHSLFHRHEVVKGIDEEIAFHLQQRTDDLVASGVEVGAAARQARLEFGDRESHRQAMRASLGLGRFDVLSQDIRYAVRILRNSPGYTIVTVASLALAIGANSTIFSVANEMLYARLGVPRAQELRLLIHEDDQHSLIHHTWGSWNPGPNGTRQGDAFTYPVYQELRRNRHGLRDIIAVKDLGRVNLTVEGNAEAGQAELVSGNFYAEMETKPALGRAILPSDDGAPGTGAVGVISYGFWQRAFGGSPTVVGRVVRVDTALVTIVGVNAPGFTGAKSVQTSPEIFLPLSMIATFVPSLGKEQLPGSAELAWVTLMGRQQPGISDQMAQTALSVTYGAATRATMTVAKGETIPRLLITDGSRGLHWNNQLLQKPIYVLLALVGFFLLLACANVANLMLARATSRQREMSVRLALGAGRSRIFRQLLTESLLLACVGGLLGLLLGFLSRNTIPRLLQTSWSHSDLNVPFDWKVFCFTAAITLMTGILFGLAPAWQASSHNVNTGLKEGSQTGSKRRQTWTGKSIVAFQVALSMLLVVGCALFLRTVMNLSSINPGFKATNLFLFTINPPNAKYSGGKSIALHDRLQEAIAALPGVEAVSVTDTPFIANYDSADSLYVEGQPHTHEERGDTSHYTNVAVVGQNFHQVMAIPLLAGRSFTSQDTFSSPEVSIINQTLANKFFSGVNPLGKRFTTHSNDKGRVWTEVIGICADTRYANLRNPPPPIHFEVYGQSDPTSKNAFDMAYLVRSKLKADILLPTLRRAVQSVDPDLPLIDVRTQDQQIQANTQQERTFASLTIGFGFLALSLACVGIYGVMAYTVAQRTNEIGIRLALGATRRDMRRMVLRESTLLAAAGVVAGLILALILARLIKSMLYGISPADPVSLALSAGVLLLLAVVASWIPASRAARVQPMDALRHD